MIADSFRRAAVAASDWRLTFLAVIVSLLSGVSYTQWFDNSDADWLPFMGLPVFVLLFVVWYFQSRRAGEPSPDEQGSGALYFGWMLLSAIPIIGMLLVYAAFTGWDEWLESDGSILEPILLGIGIAFTTPMATVAASRAINRSGPPAGRILAATLRHAGSILPVIILLTVLPTVLDDVLNQIIREEPLPLSADFGVAIYNGVMGFVIALLNGAVYASIYRWIEGKIPAEANPE
jgi:hypothetical protein